MNILMVENHDSFAKITIKEFLSDFSVDLVPTIKAAQEKLEAEYYDLILIDCDLDDGKGIDLIKYIKKGTFNLKAIGISAFEEKNRRMLDAGTDAYCCKCDFEKLNDTIKQVLKKSQAIPMDRHKL